MQIIAPAPTVFWHLTQIEQFPRHQFGAAVIRCTVHVADFNVIIDGVVKLVVHFLHAVQAGAFAECHQIIKGIGHD